MTERPANLVPVERVRGERPESADWRADGFSRSRHSRLADTLVRPLEDDDPDRAAATCAEICRSALPDFAPAFLLLPAAERRRAQTLGAFALLLFDFAAQPGLDGDRLAEINRWEFRLEEALDGAPCGQPIFVLLAREEAVRPWRREALDRLLAAARRRAVVRQRRAAADRASSLASALAEALLGAEPAPAVGALATALLEVGARRRRGAAGDPAASRRPAALVHPVPDELPTVWRPAARYLRLAARRLAAPSRERPLGLGTRLAFLARARLG